MHKVIVSKYLHLEVDYIVLVCKNVFVCIATIYKRLLKNDEDENLDTNQRLDKRYVYQIHLRDKVFFP